MGLVMLINAMPRPPAMVQVAATPGCAKIKGRPASLSARVTHYSQFIQTTSRLIVHRRLL